MNATTDHIVPWAERKLSEELSGSNNGRQAAVPTVSQQYGTIDTTANKV